jgi:AAA+ ATPase superfamily predicted ATPase
MMSALNEYGRPLYGRLTEIVVPPLAPSEIGEKLEMAPAPALYAYLVIGGFPRLAALWRRGESMWRFLERELQEPTSPVAVIGERALGAEFPADLHARAVLEAIGSGERVYGAIERRVGLAQTSLNRALESLQRKRVVLRQAPYSTIRNPRLTRYVVADEYLRFWLRFVGPDPELIERGRGNVALEHIRVSWKDYRGRAIEPLVRATLERMLPDARLGGARFVGGYWTRDNRVEVDLVGGRGERHTDVVDFVGSIKWRESSPFGRLDFAELAAHRVQVPGAEAGTLLVGVSRAGFGHTGLDVEIGPKELIEAGVPLAGLDAGHERLG